MIEGDRNRGMAVPEEIKFSKNREKVKTKSLISCDIGINDVKKSSLEKIGEVFAKARKNLF
jgi:hypothetical protein